MLLYARASVLPDYRAPGTPVFLYHREQNRLSCSRDNLGSHPREQNKPFRSRDNLSRHPREHLELSLRTGKAGWSAFFGTRPHIGRKNGHRTAELFLL